MAAEAKADEPVKGIRCPKCNCAASKVYYTRARQGANRRVRQCLYCHHRYGTKEVVTGG